MEGEANHFHIRADSLQAKAAVGLIMFIPMIHQAPVDPLAHGEGGLGVISTMPKDGWRHGLI